MTTKETLGACLACSSSSGNAAPPSDTHPAGTEYSHDNLRQYSRNSLSQFHSRNATQRKREQPGSTAALVHQDLRPKQERQHC